MDWAGGGFRRARSCVLVDRSGILRVLHHPADSRQLAVEVLDVRKALAQVGLTDAPRRTPASHTTERSRHARAGHDGNGWPLLVAAGGRLIMKSNGHAHSASAA